MSLQKEAEKNQPTVVKEDAYHQKAVRRTLIVFSTLLLAAAVFNIVGFFAISKREKLYHWADNQYFGQIKETTAETFIIKDTEKETVVLIDDKTIIKKGGQITEKPLAVGDWIMVLGRLNEQGTIQAELIQTFERKEFFDLIRKFENEKK